ncbi:aminopeptidase N [Folsomia candida]|uniref:aminopeptidase N n=1 Tax=Folsomia candida TaxID=158441 RepID=UPI000B8FCAFB|nr:aminopeptidase N [Folsomia candida]
MKVVWSTFLVFFALHAESLSEGVPPFHPESIENILFPNSQEVELKSFRVPSPRFRLPTSFDPYHYAIKIRPILEVITGDFPQWSAPGDVTIFGTCAFPTTNITLHSQVAINEASVKVVNTVTQEEVAVVGHSYDTEKTFYIIELGTSLSVGIQYSVYIEYVAEVYLENLEGLYRNHYDDPDTGVTKYSIASQLQAFGARKVFPSLDEPAMKATFDVKLGRRSNYSSICNSPLVDSSPIPGMDDWFWDTFNTTVKMPTYLLAVIISDFTYDEASPDIFHKPVRTYGPKHLIDEGHGVVPSEIAAKVLYFFEEFFDVEYSMHKMDSAAIIDFPAGAMENWGLNIYKDAYLLYALDQNNERERRGVALTLSHELAHQWAGNLITCDWWTMAWLNEGFATYLSYQGMEYTNPEYEGQKALQYDCIMNAMRNDILDNSHPTVLPDKGNPWDTMTYNANLVYSKGAALMRMMEGFLTLGTLQKALQTYMKAYSFQAANQDQLFLILTGQANADGRLPVGSTMKGIMDTWTLQKGFPLVKATLNNNAVVLTQEEYRPDNETRIYFIPIAIASQSSPNVDNTLPQFWLFQQPNGIPITHNPDEWFVANSGGTGYYRVQYDAVLTQKIQDQLVVDHEIISLGSRTQFIDDYFTLAFAGREGIEAALGFTKYMDKEQESSVWNALTYHLQIPRRLMLGRPESEGFKDYMLARVSSVLTQLQNSSDVNVGAANLFYVALVDASVAFGNQEVYNLANQYYTQWQQNPAVNPIPPLLRRNMHCAAARDLNDENFMFALNAFMGQSASSRTEIIQGLACRSDPATLELLLGVTTGTTAEIPREYSQAVITAIAGVYENIGNMIPFLMNNFDAISEYQGSQRLIANAIRDLCNLHSTSTESSIINTFVTMNRSKFTDPADLTIIDNALVTLRNNIAWMEAFGNPMNTWFNNNKNN